MTAGEHDDTEGVEATIPLEITDVLDLHSFPPRETADLVRDWLDLALAAGHRRLRVIHGKGIGTQRKIVRSLLEKDSRVAAFGDAPAEAGGWGATWLEVGDDTKAPEEGARGEGRGVREEPEKQKMEGETKG